jgi:hypothetical protein
MKSKNAMTAISGPYYQDEINGRSKLTGQPWTQSAVVNSVDRAQTGVCAAVIRHYVGRGTVLSGSVIEIFRFHHKDLTFGCIGQTSGSDEYRGHKGEENVGAPWAWMPSCVQPLWENLVRTLHGWIGCYLE